MKNALELDHGGGVPCKDKETAHKLYKLQVNSPAVHILKGKLSWAIFNSVHFEFKRQSKQVRDQTK